MTPEDAAPRSPDAERDTQIEAWVEQQLTHPDAQGPVPASAEQVITTLLANRKTRAA